MTELQVCMEFMICNHCQSVIDVYQLLLSYMLTFMLTGVWQKTQSLNSRCPNVHYRSCSGLKLFSLLYLCFGTPCPSSNSQVDNIVMCWICWFILWLWFFGVRLHHHGGGGGLVVDPGIWPLMCSLAPILDSSSFWKSMGQCLICFLTLCSLAVYARPISWS